MKQKATFKCMLTVTFLVVTAMLTGCKTTQNAQPSTLNAQPSTLHACIVKGDAKYLSIAAASVLAKTYRDDYMNHLAEEYPQYDWQSNKGYPTKKHRDAIRQYGITPYHRRSYNLLGDGQLSFDF